MIEIEYLVINRENLELCMSLRLRLFPLLLLMLWNIACSHPQLKEVHGRFVGIKTALQNDRRIKLLVIHGIGKHKPGYGEGLVDSIAKKMDMEPEFKFSIQEIRRQSISPNGQASRVQTYGYLRVQDYHHVRTDQQMRVYELTWSPTTQALKDQFLGYDGYGKFAHQRIFFNQNLKEQLINERMSEAVLYTGKYRPEMQFPIQWTLKKMLDDQFGGSNDEIVIITSSLASYMIFDTVMTLPKDAETDFDAEELLAKLNAVVMLANQLPLLLLSEVTQIGDDLGEIPDSMISEDSQERSWFEYPLLQRFIQMRISSFEKYHPGRPIPDLNVVAINDPNDLLSYPLPGYLDTEDDYVNYVNVMINLARITAITQIANPITAHTGHEFNEDVIHFIVHGSFEQDTFFEGITSSIIPEGRPLIKTQ